MLTIKKVVKTVVVIFTIVITIVLSICYYFHIVYGYTTAFISLTPYLQSYRYLFLYPYSNVRLGNRLAEQLAQHKLEGEEQYIYTVDWHLPMLMERHSHAGETFFRFDNNGSFVVLDSNTVNFLIIPSYLISFVLIKDNMAWVKEDCKNFFQKWKKKKKPPIEMETSEITEDNDV